MKRFFILLFFFSAFFSLSAQPRKLDVREFTGITVFGPFNVVLVKASEPSVEIDYNGFEPEDVIADVSRGLLRLKVKNRHYVDEWTKSSNRTRHKRYVNVTVYYANMEEIEADAGAIVKTNGRLNSKYLFLYSSMGAEVELDVNCKKIRTELSMGCDVELSGKAEVLDVKAKMGATLEGAELVSKVAYVQASMGAEVDVNATEEVDVSSSFGAEVRYAGEPAIRNTNTVLGGAIKARR